MYTLHLLFGFDKEMEEKIINLADSAVVNRRLERAGIALGGVLGLLALVWGGLSMAGGRQDVNPIQAAAAPVAVKARAWRIFTMVSVACLVAVIVALATLFGYL